jgi:hypothetical protein
MRLQTMDELATHECREYDTGDWLEEVLIFLDRCKRGRYRAGKGTPAVMSLNSWDNECLYNVSIKAS